MKLNKLFENKNEVTKQIRFFIKKKQLIKISYNEGLVDSHIQKAKHNLKFYKKNKNLSEFKDWLIIILYYTLYHCSLSLVVNKRFISKNHSATILFLIENYSIPKSDIRLINELSINKTDAQLYTDLKEDRHNASYSTRILFTDKKIDFYEKKVIEFLNKTEDIINNS